MIIERLMVILFFLTEEPLVVKRLPSKGLDFFLERPRLLTSCS